MEKSLLIQFLGENPVFKIKKTLSLKSSFLDDRRAVSRSTFDIVDFLIENKGLEVTKKDIIEGTKIARATLFKVWSQLETQEIVRI